MHSLLLSLFISFCTYGLVLAAATADVMFMPQESVCKCRLVNGVEVLARILHPGMVGKAVPANIVMKLALHGGQRCRPHMLQKYFKPYH